MTQLSLIRQSVRFYWRTHLGVVAGAAIGAMVLIGALMVGDSVKATLVSLAEYRIGKVEVSLFSQDRFFRSRLAGDLQSKLGGTVAPVLMFKGSVSTPGREKRINQVQVFGVDERFWQLSVSGRERPFSESGVIHLNEHLAALLEAAGGDTLILRLEKPSELTRDAPLSGERHALVAIRGKIDRIIGDEDFGRFSMQPSQLPPLNLYISVRVLQERLALEGKSNLILAGASAEEALTLERADTALGEVWQLEDAGLHFRKVDQGRFWEMHSDRIFLEEPIVEVVRNMAAKSESKSPDIGPIGSPQGVFSYFVNEIRNGDRATPYSIVTAADPGTGGILPVDITMDEIVISEWLQEDLGVTVGDRVMLRYFVVDEQRNLKEDTREFVIRDILSMSGSAIQSDWMPRFPGLAGVENCRDWEPGLPIDLERIRKKDEDYWHRYSGAPKAFISLEVGQEMWSNRWGNLTGLRFPKESLSREKLRHEIRNRLTPSRLGLFFEPLRERSLASTQSPIDFGQLFTGFSFFLIVAAAALTGLLFVFTLEQRSPEAGILLAVGWHPREVRRLLLLEGSVLAVIGSVIGAIAAAGYTRLVLHALSTVWRGAVGSVEFLFRVSPLTVGLGLSANIMIALIAMWLASRRQSQFSARELLIADGISVRGGLRNPRNAEKFSFWMGLVSVGGVLGLLVFATESASTRDHSAALFFVAGTLLLGAGIAFLYDWLARASQTRRPLSSLAALGRRNVSRRRGRSLTTAGILASGIFVVISVTVFRQDSEEIESDRGSGTGGFALIAETAFPLYVDLNSASGRESLGLDDGILKGVSVVPMRVRDGDDASCLNLNRALQPRLLGVRATELAQRQAFRFSGVLKDSALSDGWKLLGARHADSALPAIADEATVRWALKKSIGDTLTYTDERGEPFGIRIVGTVAGSVLQGSLIVSEDHLNWNFPSIAGYRYFLIDAPLQEADHVAGYLTRALTDQGIEVIPAWKRLAEFQRVQNTYLSIFQVLGGLGLVLGTAGLGIVVARNLVERRREFGLLRALGFEERAIRSLVFLEYRWLIVWGLTTGLCAALVAVWPEFAKTGSNFPLGGFTMFLLALFFGCVFWAWMAARIALSVGDFNALRSE